MYEFFEAPEPGELTSLLAELVSINTENPPGREVEAAQWARQQMERMGCQVSIGNVAPGRVNAIGIFENGTGPVFAFNTHLDVVPAGEGWTSDPFKLREDNGQLFARGACDAKGPLVSMLNAMQQMIQAAHQWSGTLMGVFVADEEVASIGARHYVKSAPHIDFCVIGEPTSCTTVAAHKGSMRPIAKIHGTTAHSGTPDLGVNAILKMGPLFDEVEREHERIKSRHHNLVGSPSLTVTRVAGGHADNVVPDSAELMLDRRMIPGENVDEVKDEINELVARAAKIAETHMEIVDYKPTTGGATATDLAHPIVMAAQRACSHHHGRNTEVSGFQGGCDLVHFRAVGAQGIVLGPGSLEVAHKPDEFVPVYELVLAAKIYRDIAFGLMKKT